MVTIDNLNTQQVKKSKGNSIYKIKHFIINDSIFQETVEKAFSEWIETKEGLCPIFWWENVVKPGIKSLAIAREKEINKQRRMELEALQMKLSFYLKKVRNSIENEAEFMQMVVNMRTLKEIFKTFIKTEQK